MASRTRAVVPNGDGGCSDGYLGCMYGIYEELKMKSLRESSAGWAHLHLPARAVTADGTEDRPIARGAAHGRGRAEGPCREGSTRTRKPQ